jgi:hypothetical protein
LRRRGPGIELFAHRGDQIVVTERGTGDGRGIAEGTAPADIDSTMATTALWAVWNGFLALRWRADRLRAGETQIHALVDAMTG